MLYEMIAERLRQRAANAYDFDEFEIGIPSSTKGDAERAPWKLNGKLSITTKSGALECPSVALGATRSASVRRSWSSAASAAVT